MKAGKFDAEIISHELRSYDEKDFVSMLVRVLPEKEALPIRIYLTPKSMGMARASLKKCGFDCDKQSLADLEINKNLLAGNRVPIEITESDDGRRYFGNILVNSGPSKKKVAALDKALREVKKANATGADDPPAEQPRGPVQTREVAQAVAARREQAVAVEEEEPPPNDDDLPF